MCIFYLALALSTTSVTCWKIYVVNDEIYDITDLLGKVNIITVGNTAFHPNWLFFCNHRTVY